MLSTIEISGLVLAQILWKIDGPSAGDISIGSGWVNALGVIANDQGSWSARDDPSKVAFGADAELMYMTE